MITGSLNNVNLKKQIFLLVFVLSQVNSEQEDSKNIHTTQYTNDNFSAEIKKQNHFVMFYAPWYDPHVSNLTNKKIVLKISNG